MLLVLLRIILHCAIWGSNCKIIFMIAIKFVTVESFSGKKVKFSPEPQSKCVGVLKIYTMKKSLLKLYWTVYTLFCVCDYHSLFPRTSRSFYIQIPHTVSAYREGLPSQILIQKASCSKKSAKHLSVGGSGVVLWFKTSWKQDRHTAQWLVHYRAQEMFAERRCGQGLPGGLVLRLVPSAGGLDSFPSQGTRPHMPRLSLLAGTEDPACHI